MFPKCRKYGYAWLALNGVFYAVAPRLALKMSSRTLSMGFENAEALEPKEWYANSTRAVGVGMIVAGLIVITVAIYRYDRTQSCGRPGTDLQ
ncbi:MAG: hypothetical protein V5A27_11910 [Halapricum sp.]